ncbi:MAG: sigma-70 family RNA polymerase sigma factor, partial [Planctomycetota bacterium]
VGAWLRAVVRSCAHDLWRTEHRRRRREQHAARAEAGEGRDAAEQLELQEDIVAAVRSLDEPYRTAVWLRYYEDRTPSAIAESLGEPVKTVKTRLWRALQLLRQKLDRRYGDRRAWLGALVPLAQVSNALPALTGSAAAGGLVMQAKGVVFVGASALLLVGGTVWAWPSTPPATLPASPTPAIAATVAPVAEEPPSEDSPAREAVVTAPPASRYGSLAVHVSWSDGTAAAGVAIHGEAKGEPRTDETGFRMYADATGVARKARVHGGTVNLTSDRGGSVATEVLGDQERDVDFVLPAGIEVVGTVQDERNQAVAGAEVVLVSGLGGWLGGSVVAISDDAGAFTVRSVPSKWSLGARAAGHAPSRLVDLEDVVMPIDGTPVQVQLRLLQPGATVAGKIIDENGDAMAGAIVVLGRGAGGHYEEQRVRESWSPHVVETGTDGSFRCQGVEPGQHPIVARVHGCSHVAEVVTCVAGVTTTITLVIARGVTVRGIVRNEAGEAVVGALVTTIAADQVDAPLEFAIRGDRTNPRAEVHSDEHGAFELRGAPAGTLLLRAAKRIEFDQFKGICQATMSARGGDELTWNPVLVAGKTMRVLVVDADGKPAWLGATLKAYAEQPTAMGASQAVFAEHMADKTKPINLFVFTSCANVPYTLAARLNRFGGETRWVYQRGAMPGGPDVEFRLPPQRPPGEPGHVAGTIADLGNRLAKGTLSVSLCTGAMRRDAKLDGTRFTVADVPPGRYFVWAKADDVPIVVGPWFDLQPAQRLDLGDLATEPRATIRVALRAPGGSEVKNPAAILDDGYQRLPLRWDGTHLSTDNASAGRHGLTLQTAGWSAPPRAVQLHAGHEQVVTVDVVPAALRRIHVTMPFPDSWQGCEFVLRNAAGTVMATESVAANGEALDGHRWHVWLPFDALTLEAVLDGKRHTWPVDVRDPKTAALPLRFSLR